MRRFLAWFPAWNWAMIVAGIAAADNLTSTPKIPTWLQLVDSMAIGATAYIIWWRFTQFKWGRERLTIWERLDRKLNQILGE